eukprot:4572532-Pleurochrysis_carterae.AAC.3
MRTQWIARAGSVGSSQRWLPGYGGWTAACATAQAIAHIASACVRADGGVCHGPSDRPYRERVCSTSGGPHK